MSSSASDLLLHAGAIVTTGTAGVTLVRDASRDERVLFGAGLVVAALLLAVDTMPLAGHGLPLTGWALLLFAALGHGLRAPTLTAALVQPWRLASAGAAAALLLHWAHVALPLQPTIQLGIAWFGADLACAGALAGLAWLRPELGFEGRFLLGAHAVGLAVTSFAGPQGAPLAAGFATMAAVPLLLRQLPVDARGATIAGATSFAIAIACAMRAHVGADGTSLALPGLADPLLLLATLFGLFGTSLLLAPTVLRTENAAPDPCQVAAPVLPMSAHALVHELREPLTSMMAAADLLAREPDATAHLEQLRRHGRRLDATLGNLEELERLLQHRVPLQAETFDFHATVREATNRATPGLQERGIGIRLDVLADTPRWIHGDPTRVDQLLERLVAAAARHSALGPIDVTVFATENHLHIAVLSHATATTPNEDLEVLFSRQLAVHLGGELRRRLRENGGVELHATIRKELAPGWEIDLSETDDEPRRTAAPATGRVQGRVLLVEDSPDHSRLIGHLVARAGADVATATTGDVALHLLSSESFDLVLLDMQMPGKDGYTTVAELRAAGSTVPVVALTADSAPTDVERCLAAGCNGHLGKPVDVSALQQTLAMHLPTPAV